MKTDAVTPADLGRSVIAVPPMARDAAGKVSATENRKIVDHLAGGGVSSFLYGGNANFYHLGLAEYAGVLEMMAAIAPEGAWMIPSIGPDFGSQTFTCKRADQLHPRRRIAILDRSR